MMTDFNRDQIRANLKAEPDGLHQALLNLGYDQWQKERDWNFDDVSHYLCYNYGEVVEMALLLGKYNQQVQNGGHAQYFYNGYSGSHKHAGCDEYDYNVPLARRLETLMKKYQLNTTNYGGQVADCLKDFINRHHSWEGNSERDDIHDENDCYDENDFPDTDDLDTAYYKVNEWWEPEMERYFKLWMEFNENPIESGRF